MTRTDNPARRGARSRLRLRARLALALSVLAGLSAAAVAASALFWVETTLDGQSRRKLEQRTEEAELRLRRLGREVRSRLEGIDSALRGTDAGLLESLLTGRGLTGARVLRAAEGAMRLSGLDVLAFLDAGGKVLSSGHWPQQAAHADLHVLELPADTPSPWMVETAMGRLPAVVALRPVRAGRREIHLFGGLALDDAFLDDVAGGEAALLLDAAGKLLAGGGRAGEIASAVASAAPSGGLPLSSALEIAGEAGGPWSVRAKPIQSYDGARFGYLVLAVDLGGQRALLTRLRWSFLLLGGAGSLLAALAGLWIARTVTRPVAALVRSVDQIARGEADYTFPRQADHELDELVQSFSRLHRTLALQQQRALAAERVAAWREVARRVAHEIKNPLAPIRLTVENLIKARRRAPAVFDGLFEEGTRTILEEVGQLQRMVTEFSEFARLPEPEPAPTDVEALLDAVLAPYAGEPGLRIRRAGERLPRATVDAGQVSQALRNVVQNAIEAMGERGGELLVATGVDEGMLRVEISDQGTGFSPEALRRVTEPYFTTKSSGTGLGMAIASRIVTEHGGVLEWRNRTGGGATVIVRLPDRHAEGRNP